MGITTYGNLDTNTAKDIELNNSPESIATSSTTLFSVELDNTKNVDDSYCHIYNVSSAPTVGTTKPDTILWCPALSKKTYVFGAHGYGKVYGTGIFIAGTTSGLYTGTTSPTNKFKANLKTS